MATAGLKIHFENAVKDSDCEVWALKTYWYGWEKLLEIFLGNCLTLSDEEAGLPHYRLQDEVQQFITQPAGGKHMKAHSVSVSQCSIRIYCVYHKQGVERRTWHYSVRLARSTQKCEEFK